MSKTSLSEIENQFLIVRDLGYITLETYKEFETKAEETQKLLGGLIKSAASKPSY